MDNNQRIQPTLYNKSRKIYVCNYCKEMIPVGSKYVRTRIWTGRVHYDGHKFHEHCYNKKQMLKSLKGD